MSDQFNEDLLEIEKKKVKALEKIANSLDALTIWFDEIDKEEWSNRIQFYLSEFHTKFVKEETSDNNLETPAKKNGDKKA